MSFSVSVACFKELVFVDPRSVFSLGSATCFANPRNVFWIISNKVLGLVSIERDASNYRCGYDWFSGLHAAIFLGASDL